MNTPQELVDTLISQRRQLQADLGQVSAAKSPETIEKLLAVFKTHLATHLNLENGVFYPDYLNKKIKNGEEIESTKEFIGIMNDIATKVTGFLDTYSHPAPQFSLAIFKTDLSKIIDVLNSRIETEEDGVYDIYLSLN